MCKPKLSLMSSYNQSVLAPVEEGEQLDQEEDEEVQSNNDKPRMLFVNDEEFLRFTYTQQLCSDFKIDEAENGLQALQMVSTKPKDYYQVIILDINMPIMDGFEACDRIDKYLSKKDSVFDVMEGNYSY